MNKNLPELTAEQMQAFLECAGLASILTIEDIFPLEYTTQITSDEVQGLSGRFDMSFDEITPTN